MKRQHTYSLTALRSIAAACAMAVILLLGNLVPAGVYTAYAAASLTLSRSTVAPGDQVVASGSGYSPGDNVIVYADFTVGGAVTRTQVATSTTENGTFRTTFTVPHGTVPGSYRVTARDFHTGIATQVLNVLPLAQLIVGAQPGTITVAAGHFFFVRGSGFKAGETVRVTATFPLYNGNAVSVSRSVSADGNGTLGELSIQVPRAARAGTVALTAKGDTSGKVATANVNVTYRPTVSLNPGTVRPGATVLVSGSGFVPNTTIHVSVTVPRQGASTVTLSKDVTAGDRGAFTVSLTLPVKTPPGVYTVNAVDAAGGFHTSAQLAVTLKPVIAVLPHSIAPGHTVTVNGSGFTAYASVTLSTVAPLYGGGSRTVARTVQTDATGSFSAPLTIPSQAAAGTLIIVASGPNGSSRGSVIIQRVPAHIALSPTPVRPGATVTVTGNGYPARDRVSVSIPVKLSNGTARTLATTVATDALGLFSARIVIPAEVVAGTYTVTARSESTNRAPSARLQVAVSARVALQPYAVSPGGMTTVSGRGFSSGVVVTVSANVPLYGGGSKTVMTTARTDGSGAFTTRLAIPGNAAAGPVTVIAKGPHAALGAGLQVKRIPASLTLSASSIIPGTALVLHGSGYPAGDTVRIATVVRSANGATHTVSASVRTDARGAFDVTLDIPATIAGGSYTVTATSESTGRAPHATFTVVTLKPSLIAAPTTASPGTQITAEGLGFAAGEGVTLQLNGKNVGTATAGTNGQFTVKVTIGTDLATGPYALSATGNAGHSAATTLSISRSIVSHFYFASIYTGPGHEEDLAFVNPSSIRAQVRITYQRTAGVPLVKTVSVAPHSRFTENANTDLGAKVSAAASIAADVPIGADLIKYQGNEGSVIPGSRSPSTIWYFANGNTSGQYREYLALQNPNGGPVQAVIHLFPTHHRPMTLYRMLPANSRLTIKVNTFVRDAVGVTITSNGPIVANRTVKIRHGIDSKNGVVAPQRTWYFAAGPRDPNARHWIGIVNPTGQRSYVTLRAYGDAGRQLGIAQGWLKAGGRGGYLINRIAHQADASVVITASQPIVSEQTTYIGGNHDADTDAFGVPAPGKSWAYAAVTTSDARGAQDYLDLFNPNLTALPVVVQFMTASGQSTERTYVVGPLSHQRIDVGSVAPNSDLGILATSNAPFVGLNRTFYHHRLGGSTSQGVQP